MEMNIRRSFTIFFNSLGVLLLASLLATGEKVITPQNKINCTYAVTVETTCIKGAETRSPISVRFGDTNKNDVLIKHLNSKHVRKVDPLEPEVLDDVPRRPFQACMVDQFHVEGQCVDSPICYLYLKLSGNDDWRPGYVQVRTLELGYNNLNSDFFYFRRYLPRKVWHGIDLCDKDNVTPFGIKPRRKIFVNKSSTN
ncbi:embryo-specific protein ATS3A-like [Humulus lupulus]|uniref:embryo-specific protein ATS3A-like n=1 Tax=Humulus lupulus TaxID=3486 RepID=UPI002B405F68|nr:embryo-specific protein ATS3A-like [Humulus lupulus]